MIIYVWSRKDPYKAVSFFGFAFSAWQFPFVMALFHFLLGSSPVTDLLGIVVGHLFHFIMDIVPSVYGVSLMKTPQFLYNIFEQGNVQARNQDWQRQGGYRLNQ